MSANGHLEVQGVIEAAFLTKTRAPPRPPKSLIGENRSLKEHGFFVGGFQT